MAKHVLFLVHGMGSHNAGWSAAEDGPAAVLSKAAEAYSDFTAQRPLKDSVEFVEIRYDDIFDKLIERWAELARSLEGKLPEATSEEITKVTDSLAAADDPANWFAAQGMDVVFYTAFALVRRLVLLRVASKIMTTIADAGDDRKYSLLAHSLGTTVAHDAIHKMATTPWVEDAKVALDALGEGDDITDADLDRALRRYGNNPFSPGLFKFEAIFMISNTSVLLQKSARNPFESAVRPSFSGGGARTNSCLRFYNVDHRFDPISKVRRFRAAEAWPRAAAAHTAKDVFDIEHVHDVNVHALEHYLTHPRVHREILASVSPARFRAPDYELAQKRVEPGGDFPTWGDKYVDEDLQDEILERFEALRIRDRDALARILAAMPTLIADIRSRVPS